jgi:hypothetical protein
MDEQQIRALVRDAIARHLGPQAGPSRDTPVPAATAASAGLISHMQFQIIRPADETECIIEPSVACNHCGHCQCYGH